ncbi:MAG TPA: hypothetical protein VGL48_13420, partial [Acidimicrobiales bacterium]
MDNERTTQATPRRYTKLIGAASALAALMAFGSAATGNAATSTSTSPELFPNSSFDHSVVNQPVSADRSNYMNHLVNQYATNYGSVGVNRMPIFTVPANQPLVPVSLASGCYGSFLSTLGNGVPIPPSAYTTNSSDEDIIISQPSTGQEWELWQATQTNGHWSACWGGGLSLGSTGVFPAPYGMSATGISYLATTITEADVASGHINHAIAMQIVNCNGYVAPADRGDCTSFVAPVLRRLLHLPTGSAGAPPEGTWFRMPQSTPMPAGLTPYAQMVFRTLQTYGAVVVDKA